MCNNDCSFHEVHKSLDRSYGLWGQVKKAQNLGHVGPGDHKLAGEVSPRLRSTRLKLEPPRRGISKVQVKVLSFILHGEPGWSGTLGQWTSTKVFEKVLPFVTNGGPGWTRTIDLGLIRTAL